MTVFKYGHIIMLLLYASASKTKAFASVGPQVACVLSVAVMEVVHPLFGWVKSSPVTTAMQVGHSSLAAYPFKMRAIIAR